VQKFAPPHIAFSLTDTVSQRELNGACRNSRPRRLFIANDAAISVIAPMSADAELPLTETPAVGRIRTEVMALVAPKARTFDSPCAVNCN
jgi:hypothetical protein